MKKRIIGGLILAGAAVTTLAACGSEKVVGYEGEYVAPTYVNPAHDTKVNGGDVFHIYAWNTEFQGFFNKYLSDEGKAGNYSEDTKTFHLDGKEVKWTITPSDNGAYQQALDKALMANETAKGADKIDMFLAEADYILKYTNSKYTYDISKIGVTNMDNIYTYTKEAASDSKGVVKGVSFQCCPSAMIYRRSIAKDVLGTDDPAKVQAAVNSWAMFDDVAKKAKDKGYYMTASYAETYRVFSNNVTKPWVTTTADAATLQFDSNIETWMNQAKNYVDNGYTLTAGVWDDEKNAQMFATGKTMTFFGPAWYFNFCMGNAQDKEKGCYGDWAICQGPQSHFWGGTWMLSAQGGDNDDLVAKTMDAFLNDEELCTKLIANEAQFTNNKKVNEAYAKTNTEGNKFLGGQNDTAIFCESAKNIKFQNQTTYDQYCNEGLQNAYCEYLKGTVSYVKAMNNFYSDLHVKCADITTKDVAVPTIK